MGAFGQDVYYCDVGLLSSILRYPRTYTTILFVFCIVWYTNFIMAYEPEQKRLTSGQKVGFSFMLIFACMAVGLGMMQMRSTIYSPFVRSNSTQVNAAEQAQGIFDESVRMQRIDTDQDGLNDFEELNFYQTSPYLPDTDSDGLSDKKELDEGMDPLCPEGRDCGLGSGNTFEITEDEDKGVTNPLLDQALDDTGAILGDTNTTGTPGLQQIGTMLQDPKQLRAALLASGQISPEDLATINDEQLLDLAQQALKSQGASGSELSVAPAQKPDVTPEQLEALLEKPDELRALLLSTGKMTTEQLDQIDNETLVSVVQDIISTPQQ